MHKSTIPELFKNFQCDECGRELSVVYEDVQGFARTIVVNCLGCEEFRCKAPTSPRIQKKNSSTRPPFSVNRKMVEAFVSLGLGYAGLEKFGMEIGMKVMSSTAWKKHLKDLEKGSAEMKTKILEEARQAVRKVYNTSDQETLDITVSTDGTWQKRGHVSLHGAAFAIEFETGLVIDYQVLSRHCHIHTVKASMLGADSGEYQEWYSQHKDSGECQVCFINTVQNLACHF